jgi:pimeloyl-ACP methyl ester carboxylesterase
VVAISRLSLAALCFASALIGCSTGNSAGRKPTTPRFGFASCLFKVSFGVKVRCGYLTVPENHTKSHGRTIKLAVAVFKSQAVHRFPDPVIYLGGGPGSQVLGSLGPIVTLDNEHTVVGDRDLVLIDQRGTGYSQPALTCPGTWTVSEGNPVKPGNAGLAAAIAAQERAYRGCRDHLLHAGIDLGAYTTPENAADIADLRRALGYTSVNLYGISYGTRLALSIMRTYPQGIRSVVLDSVLPPQFDEAMQFHNMDSAFTTLFAGCAASALCSQRFPHLQATFYHLAARLDVHPMAVHESGGTSILLTGDRLARVVFQSLYSRYQIPLVPKMLYQLASGKQALLKQIAPQLELLTRAVAVGMNVSVDCADNIEGDSAAQVRSSVSTVPPQLRADYIKEALGDLKTCSFWGMRAVSPVEKLAVHSSIPTLILDGQYDPITPPAYGALVEKTLKHAYRFVFPGDGHGIRFTGTCSNGIAQAFIDHPGKRPDSSCIAGIASAF